MKNPQIIIPTVILSRSRSVAYRPSLSLPEWASAWVFPEYVSTDRPKLDIGRIFPLSFQLGNSSTLPAYDAFDTIKTRALLGDCLNLEDGVSIATYEHCHSIFKGKKPHLWQSVVRDSDNNLFVPQVQNIRGQMPIIYWLYLDYIIEPDQCLSFLM